VGTMTFAETPVVKVVDVPEAGLTPTNFNEVSMKGARDAHFGCARGALFGCAAVHPVRPKHDDRDGGGGDAADGGGGSGGGGDDGEQDAPPPAKATHQPIATATDEGLRLLAAARVPAATATSLCCGDGALVVGTGIGVCACSAVC
jgi:hypothetical protein